MDDDFFAEQVTQSVERASAQSGRRSHVLRNMWKRNPSLRHAFPGRWRILYGSDDVYWKRDQSDCLRLREMIETRNFGCFDIGTKAFKLFTSKKKSKSAGPWLTVSLLALDHITLTSNVDLG